MSVDPAHNGGKQINKRFH